MKSKSNRLAPRMFHDIEYVLGEDIQNFHGKIWTKKYDKAAGVNTCMIVPANDPSHEKPEEQIAIYYWDYTRFADLVDFNKPTYWD